MVLNSKSRLVRWTYWFFPKKVTYTPGGRRESNIPTQTSLCRFFWQAVLITPLMTLPALLIIGLIAGVVWLGGVCTIIAALWRQAPKPKIRVKTAGIRKPLGILADSLADKTDDLFTRFINHPIWGYLKNAKKQMCPIITFEEGKNGAGIVAIGRIRRVGVVDGKQNPS